MTKDAKFKMIIRKYPYDNHYLVVPFPRSRWGESCARPKILIFNAGGFKVYACLLFSWEMSTELWSLGVSCVFDAFSFTSNQAMVVLSMKPQGSMRSFMRLGASSLPPRLRRPVNP